MGIYTDLDPSLNRRQEKWQQLYSMYMDAGLTGAADRVRARGERRFPGEVDWGVSDELTDAALLRKTRRGGLDTGALKGMMAERRAGEAVDEAVTAAKPRMLDAIGMEHANLLGSLSSIMGAPIDPTSPAVQATAARYIQARGESTQTALNSLAEWAANAKLGIQSGIGMSVANTLQQTSELVRALEMMHEAEKKQNRAAAGRILSNPFSLMASAVGADRETSMAWGAGMKENFGMGMMGMGATGGFAGMPTFGNPTPTGPMAVPMPSSTQVSPYSSPAPWTVAGWQPAGTGWYPNGNYGIV